MRCSGSEDMKQSKRLVFITYEKLVYLCLIDKLGKSSKNKYYSFFLYMFESIISFK
jgi:hypothetical protein